jgi:hypothetical protein
MKYNLIFHLYLIKVRYHQVHNKLLKNLINLVLWLMKNNKKLMRNNFVYHVISSTN